jgi:hypothetical protein
MFKIVCIIKLSILNTTIPINVMSRVFILLNLMTSFYYIVIIIIG